MRSSFSIVNIPPLISHCGSSNGDSHVESSPSVASRSSAIHFHFSMIHSHFSWLRTLPLWFWVHYRLLLFIFVVCSWYSSRFLRVLWWVGISSPLDSWWFRLFLQGPPSPPCTSLWDLLPNPSAHTIALYFSHPKPVTHLWSYSPAPN